MRAHDAFGAVAALAATQHGAFSRRQAATLGVGPRELYRLARSGFVDERLPGALVVAGCPASWHQQVQLATLANQGLAVAAGRSAARLHGLDGCRDDVVEVAVPRNVHVRLPGVVVHRVASLPRPDVVRIDAIPCTGLARTLADLGDVLPSDRVLQALDDARRRQVSLGWLRSTAERLRRPGCHGPTLLAELVATAADEHRVPDSWFERLLAAALACPDLPPLVAQHAIRDRRGRLVARVDLAAPSLLLGIEAHSRKYHHRVAAAPSDEDRDLAVAAEGWQLLYLGWQDARSPARAVALLRRVAAQRRRQLGSAAPPAPGLAS